MLTCNMCSIDFDCIFNNSHKNNVDMKANEAPERLYLSETIYSTYLYQVPDPDDETAVEYTRTDAFIEKAVKWLEDNAINYWGTDAVDNGMMLERFKEAMRQ